MTRSLSTFALAAATLALAAPAGARTIDNWEVTPNGPFCSMISTFSDNVSIGLIWTPKSGELNFMTALPHPNTLGGQHGAAIELTFDGNGPYTQWEDQKATIIPGSDSDAVVASWGAEHSAELAKAVGAASHVAVSIGGKAIGTYDLSGNPAAYRELTHCGSQLASK